MVRMGSQRTFVAALCLLAMLVSTSASHVKPKAWSSCSAVSELTKCKDYITKGYYNPYAPKYYSPCCQYVRKESLDCLCTAANSKFYFRVDVSKVLGLAKKCGKQYPRGTRLQCKPPPSPPYYYKSPPPYYYKSPPPYYYKSPPPPPYYYKSPPPYYYKSPPPPPYYYKSPPPYYYKSPPPPPPSPYYYKSPPPPPPSPYLYKSPPPPPPSPYLYQSPPPPPPSPYLYQSPPPPPPSPPPY